MRCFGITKARHRCKNTGKLPFCSKHLWQPLSALVLVVSLIGFGAGLFQDLIKPLKEWSDKDAELRKPLAVEIKSNRRTVPDWLKDPDPTKGEPDIVTILLDRRPVKTLEIFHSAKDQRFRDYPPTAPLTDFRIPTSAQYEVIDLDGDDIPEVVISLSNQIYSLHYDKLVSVLILNPRGELIAKTPYPTKIEGLEVSALNPYSAYQTTGVKYDAISSSSDTITFANGFHVADRNGQRVLQFSWVIDNASYMGPHLHQVQEMVMRDGSLVPLLEKPALYISEDWNEPWSGKVPVDIETAKAFLKEHNLPPFSEMIKEAKESFPTGPSKPNPLRQGPLPPRP